MSCGSVGRVVACDTRDPRFESCHGQIFPWSPDCCCTFGQLYWKDENMYKKCRECTQFYQRGRNFVWKTKQNYLENWPNDHSGSWYKIKINSRHNWAVVQKQGHWNMFRSQCDQMVRLLFYIWPFSTMNICQVAKIFPKLGSKLCQFQFQKRFFNIGQNGKISLNLVTLIVPKPVLIFYDKFHWLENAWDAITTYNCGTSYYW